MPKNAEMPATTAFEPVFTCHNVRIPELALLNLQFRSFAKNF